MGCEMAKSETKLPSKKSSEADVTAFLSKVATTPVSKRAGERGRLIFALDATAYNVVAWSGRGWYV